MPTWRSDWGLLGLALLLTLAVIAVGLAARQTLPQQSRYQHAEGLYAVAVKSLQRYQQARQQQSQFADDYQRFVDKGYFVESSREVWLALLSQAQAEVQLAEIGYRFEPPESFKGPLNQVQQFWASVRLQFEARHEGEVLQLLTYLRQHAPGLYALQGCELEPHLQRGKGVSVDCLIHWGWLEKR